jgi:hypothetical protein
MRASGIDESHPENFDRCTAYIRRETDTAFYRNANYHTMWDTAERLDYQRMSQAVEAVCAAVIDQTR